MRSDETACTRFLNVDFDVDGDHSIAELVAALGQTVIVLRQTDNSASFELTMDCASLQTCLDGFVQMIDGLSQQARDVWDRCTVRTANIGVQAGSQPYSAGFPIAHRTIAALAAIGCGVAFTVYATPTRSNAVP